MNSTSQKSSPAHEYVFKFKEKISPEKKKGVIEAIKTNVLFHRSYDQDGNTWYEMRSPENQNDKEAPEASLLISADFIYLMRKSKSSTLWDNLDTLRDYIQDDLDFICEGAFYSCIK
jgi:hypothetical protein